MRVLIAGVLGAIAMFSWTSIAHVALPLGQTGFSHLSGEPAALGAMKAARRTITTDSTFSRGLIRRIST